MQYQEGYVYHMKDEYFVKANDPNLMQNMFPITEKYLDHIHTRNNNPVPVKHSIQAEVKTKMKRILQLHSRGKKMVFPDITRLKNLMLKEIL